MTRTIASKAAWVSGVLVALGLGSAGVAQAQENYDDSGPWYDDLEISAFVDAYGAVNYGFPKPQENTNALRSFDGNNGFSLNWFGLDLRYDLEEVAATADLRLGPGAALLAGPDANYDLEVVKQAFATWRPWGYDSALTLDFGKFDGIYGAEASDAQPNMNYTRGLLFTYCVPAFLTGFRAGLQPWESVGFKFIAANGWNNSIDNNAGKTFGAQVTLSVPGDDPTFDAALGYLVGPEQSDVASIECGPGFAFDADRGCVTDATSPGGTFPVDGGSANAKGLRHLVDLIATVTPVDWVTILMNGDLVMERIRLDGNQLEFETVKWYGGSLGLRFQLTDVWAVAGRGEVLWDPDGQATGTRDLTAGSGTLTLEAAPSPHLLLRLDNRIDAANASIFSRNLRDTSKHQLTSTLGVIVMTN